MKIFIILFIVTTFLYSCNKDDEKKVEMGEKNGVCFEDKSCNSGLECYDDNICRVIQNGHEGGACLANGACDNGLVCNSDMICIKDPCLTVVCEDYKHCVLGVCKPLEGRCDSSEDCEVGYWCAAGNLCSVPGVCEPVNPCKEINRTVCVPDGDSYSCECEEGFIDFQSSCKMPLSSYQFHQAGFFYNIDIPSNTASDRCCFDFNNDGELDNKLGTLLKALSSITQINYDALLNNDIERDRFGYLIEYRDAWDTDNIVAPIYESKDSDNIFENNISGEGNIFAKKSSFKSDGEIFISESKETLNGIKNGEKIYFESDYTDFLKIPFFAESITLELTMYNFKLEGDLYRDDFGIWIKNGKLGGKVPMMRLLDAYNSYYIDKCECLNLPEGLFYLDEENVAQCRVVENNECPTNSECSSVIEYCGMISASLVPDVDTDNDNINDSLSFGMRFETAPVSITGVYSLEK
ncbi:hypothetical protein JXR93_10820 [bacterium]|nr:hypothetical protein [bacterium]